MTLLDTPMDVLLDSSHGKPKLLVVDDQPINIQVMHQIFGADFQVFMATSGAQALAICQANPPDLVLLDVVMPGMDGIETLKEMRKIETSGKDVQLFGKRSVKTRIIMQTASTDPADFMTSFIEGRCNGYITKPYSKNEILEKVFG